MDRSKEIKDIRNMRYSEYVGEVTRGTELRMEKERRKDQSGSRSRTKSQMRGKTGNQASKWWMDKMHRNYKRSKIIEHRDNNAGRTHGRQVGVKT